jgi:hypothetical protein
MAPLARGDAAFRRYDPNGEALHERLQNSRAKSAADPVPVAGCVRHGSAWRMRRRSGMGGQPPVPCQRGGGAWAFCYVDKCPTDGDFGSGTQRKPCPIGAVCPGGFRMWPLVGHWTSSEMAGYVLRCLSTPVGRCCGGRNSECAPGYGGVLCSACTEGYHRLLGARSVTALRRSAGC